jgi:hypothetical protein
MTAGLWCRPSHHQPWKIKGLGDSGRPVAKVGLTVYTPPPRERDDVTAETLRKRQWQREHEPDALRDWRARMASKAGQAVYRRRKLTEHAHAKMKNRGFARMAVHGIAKVRAVCLLHALAHNMMQAHGMRAATA